MALLSVWRDTVFAAILACRREGMIAPEAIQQWATDEFAHRVNPHDLAEALPGILASTSEVFTAEQRSWPATTDCDRLDAAFGDLNERGIMARHHIPQPLHFYSQHDLLSGMHPSLPVRGFAAYDREATEQAAQGMPLAVEAASSDGNDAGDAAIMNEVVAVLRTHGLAPSWDGSLVSSIFVDLNWKRRRPPSRWLDI